MTVDTQALRAKMTYHNLIQKDMAQALGVTRTTLNIKLQTGDFKISEIHRLMETIPLSMKEVEEIAIAQGVKDTQTMMAEALATFSKMIPEGKTSMLQDIESNRKTEVEMFASTVIELGEKHNIPTPYNKVLKDMIEIIETKSINDDQ